MAFLSGTVEGSSNNSLYYFSASDPTVFLLADAVYLQKSTGWYAIAMEVANASFYVAGKVMSSGYGVIVRNALDANISVLETGVISARTSAIDVDGNSGGTTITNAGLISSNGTAINVTFDNPFKLVNTGTITTTGVTAIRLTGGWDTIRNTGMIIGDVQLGLGDDLIDNRGGVIQGTIHGGDGGDTFYLNGDERVVEIYNGSGSDTVYASSDHALSAYVENLVLQGQARNAVGNFSANQIFGSALGGTLTGAGGDDTIAAGDGASILYGNTGDDNLTGGSADDVLWGGSGDDTLLDYAGDNVLNGGAGDDTFDPGVDDDRMDGGVGTDTVTYFFASGPVAASLLTNTATGGGVGTDTFASIEALIGSTYADVLTGNALANGLSGGEGDDLLAGGGGDDVLNGGGGADRLEGGNGVDTASYAGEFAGARVNLATGVLAGVATGDVLVSIENLFGSDRNDIFVGSDVANRLDGGEGNDQLTGGAGEDVLVGGYGDDRLTGGNEKDIFLFANPQDGTDLGADTIRDFQNGVDLISFVGNGMIDEFSDLIITKVGSSVVIDTVGFGAIKVLNVAPGDLTAADFVFG